MQIEQRKGWNDVHLLSRVWSRNFANFSARNFHELHRGAGTETEKALFSFTFLRSGTSILLREKKELTGALGIYWRGRCCCMCALHIKLLFLLVDIQHSQCPRWFFVLEIQALWSQNYDTGGNGKTVVQCHAITRCVLGYDRRNMHTPATPIDWKRQWKSRNTNIIQMNK